MVKTLILTGLALLLQVQLAFQVPAANYCPCERQELCNVIQGEREFEVFVFDVGGTNWQHYDWKLVTTVAMFGPSYDPQLMCQAHSVGARVVLRGIPKSLSALLTPELRSAWISQQVALAKQQFMDGINLDIEEPVAMGSPEYHALTALVQETVQAFHKEIPGSQVSFDFAWSPNHIDGRYYDYAAIAEAVDIVFVMSYDEQSQIWGECIAMANAPFFKTLEGYHDYLAMNIDPSKIVMGVPWYGYDYPCESLSDNVCTLAKVDFRGAPCSDAAGTQKPFSWMMENVKAKNSLTGYQYDYLQQAPYFNYQDDQGKFHQVWFDDPMSICVKGALVGIEKMRGIGMWNGDQLNYSDELLAKVQTALMWNALRCADIRLSDLHLPHLQLPHLPHLQLPHLHLPHLQLPHLHL